MTSGVFGRLADWQLKHRAVSVALVLALSAVALWLLQDLSFDFRPEALQQFSAEEQSYIDEFAERYNTQANVLLVVLDGGAPGAALSNRGLTLQYRIAELAEATPFAERIFSLPQLPRKDPAARLLALGTGRIPPLVEGLPVTPQAEELTRRQVAGSRMIPDQLVARDGSAAAVVILLEAAYGDHTVLDRPLRAFEKALEDLMTEEAATAEGEAFVARFAGLPFVRVETVRNLKSEQRIFWPVTAVLYLVLLWFLYRDPFLTVLPLLAVGLASLWSLAVLPATGTSVNVVNNIVPSLILVIGVCNAVHMLHGYRAARQDGAPSPGAARRMMDELGLPAFLTTFTTAIGFLSLMVARNPTLERLGWQAGAGVMLSYLALVLVLPPVTGSLSPKATTGRRVQEGGYRWMDPLVRWTTSAPRLALTLALAVLALCLWAGSRVAVDANVIDTFPPGHPIYESNQLVEKKLGGIQPLEVELVAEEDGFFTNPEVLARVFDIQREIVQLPTAIQARSVVDLIAEVHEVVADDDVPAMLTREKVDSALELMRLHQAGALSQYITDDGRRLRIASRLEAAGIQATLATIGTLEERGSEWLESFPGPVQMRLTGNAYISARGLDYFIRDLSFSLMTASVVIFFVLVVVFRSVRMGLLGVLPTLLPLAITLALVPVYGYQLNTSTAVVFTITIGMAVDNTIHLLTRFRTLRREGRALESAIRHTFRQAGAAVVASNLLLIAGFSVLFSSDFEPVFRVAALTTTTIAAAMLAALLVLPGLLKLFGEPIGEEGR